MLTALIDRAGARCADALSAPELTGIAAAVERSGMNAATGERFVREITEHDPRVRNELLAARNAIACVDGSVERLLLLRAALQALPRIPSLPVSDDVKRLFCEGFEYVAAPPPGAVFDASRASFVAMAKLVTLRRFPAGQFHWEMSGLPRSWLLKVTGRDRVRLLYWLAARLKGRTPVFFLHLNAQRRNRYLLTEREADKSYFRMAQSIALQPGVKGLVASSWLNSPDTFAVSPHLGWMNRTFLDNGALVVTMGPADPNSGVLARSPERKQAYQAGTFRPTVGLVIWPRDAMLAWAAAHPELGARRQPVAAPNEHVLADASAGYTR
jgi:hypothetical protein